MDWLYSPWPRRGRNLLLDASEGRMDMYGSDWMIASMGLAGLMVGSIAGFAAGWAICSYRVQRNGVDGAPSAISRLMALDGRGIYAARKAANAQVTGPDADSEFPPTQMMPLHSAKARGLAAVVGSGGTALASPSIPPASREPARLPNNGVAQRAREPSASLRQIRPVTGRLRLKYQGADDVVTFRNLDLVAFGFKRARLMLLADCEEFGRQVFEAARIQACLDLESRKLVPDVRVWLEERSPGFEVAEGLAGIGRATRPARAPATLLQ